MKVDKEFIDYSRLYEVGTNLFNKSNLIKENLNKIDSYMKDINNNQIWNSKIKDAIVDKYSKERKQLNILYQELISYSKTILEIVSTSEDFAKQASKMVESLNNELLWPI